MKLIDKIIDPFNSSNWDACEIVFYSIYSKESIIDQAVKGKLDSFYNSIFNTERYFKLRLRHWVYGNCQGILVSLDFSETNFSKKWLNLEIDKENLEQQLLEFLLEIYNQTKPIFSTICEWPNDQDFLGKHFANHTDVLISEFNNKLIKSIDYNESQWLDEFLKLNAEIITKYGEMTN